jgi:hypothetical protein
MNEMRKTQALGRAQKPSLGAGARRLFSKQELDAAYKQLLGSSRYP